MSTTILQSREGQGSIGRWYRYYFGYITVLWGDTGKTDTDTDTDTDTWFSGEKKIQVLLAQGRTVQMTSCAELGRRRRHPCSSLFKL
jgi:hypothetical protein